MSLSSLETLGLALPRPTMSKACSSGTPAFIMVASWRVKIAMSLGLILAPERMRRFLILVGEHALAPQRGLDLVFAGGAGLAAHRLAVAVPPFPFEDEFRDFGCCCCVAMRVLLFSIVIRW